MDGGADMEVLVIAVAAALVSALALMVGLRMYRLWRAAMQGTEPLLMHRVLEHQGASLEGRSDQGTMAQLARATQGCLLCRDQDTCRAWLAGESSASLQEFCPNAELIGRLKTDRRAAG